MRRALLLATLATAVAVVAAALAIHRASVDRALAALRLDELRTAVADARAIAREDYAIRLAGGLPVDELRAREASVARAALVLEQVDLLEDELALSLAAGALAPFLAGLLLLGVVGGLVLGSQLRPLGQATRAVRAWAAGDEGRFPLGRAGGREVAELREALDGMVATLRSQREQLAAQSRALGWRDVAREVSHEMKNLLTPVRMAAERLVERDLDAGGRGDQDAILASLGPIERLSRALADLSRREPIAPRPVEARAVFASCASLHAARGIVIETGGGDATVLADPAALAEALSNLVVNAAQAGAARVVLSVVRRDGRVLLRCEDDGPGIAPEVLRRVGTPGFTTRRDGSGFGVAFARRVAEQSGGSLQVDSAQGRGTVVILELPDGDAAGRG